MSGAVRARRGRAPAERMTLERRYAPCTAAAGFAAEVGTRASLPALPAGAPAPLIPIIPRGSRRSRGEAHALERGGRGDGGEKDAGRGAGEG